MQGCAQELRWCSVSPRNLEHAANSLSTELDFSTIKSILVLFASWAGPNEICLRVCGDDQRQETKGPDAASKQDEK